ncbi:MAG TPA: helix-turn-helix domain-containing protein [Pyrinomonadaceae bacterium]
MGVTPESNVITETTWNKQTRNLATLSHLLLQDLQKIETLFCFDLKNRINLSAEIRRFEKNLIKTALLHTGGSQKRSAALLGISPARLSYKMKIYRINFGRPGKPLP